MRGAWIDESGVRYREDLPAPQPRAGHSVVRVQRAGVCATDLALARGYMRFRGVPGHEFVGIADDGPFAGQRVVGEINAACGHCDRCSRGDGRHCAQRTVLGIAGHAGAFAERLLLPNRNLHRVPAAVSDEAATFTEPLAAAFEITEQIAIAPGTEALVIGDGKLGLLCAHVLAQSGCKLTVAGRHPERQDLLPAGTLFLPRAFESSSAAASRRFTLIVEATGRSEVLARAFDWIEPRGTIVLKTTTERPAALDLARLVVDEVTLLGSRCGPFVPALAALAEGKLPIHDLVDSTYPLSRAPEAIGHAGRGGTLKVLIDPSG